ncbi:photosynthetic reaction center subunit H [Bradyrhizobium sp. SZCCHNS3051]|uniref:photosynthetic reaction center subunit H n=1 Tax=Bradyrhizobium sp. SZCCHNS3051 TaxID=3057320 RepID=UPI0029164B7C|nr:photosynthetic reaction center subunit H [Bradyrhizobium sp. SZCCHNS3051]
MQTSFTSYIDVAQVVLYGFWVFFAALIFYLRTEDKREGYPLQFEGRVGRRTASSGHGFPTPPSPKTYHMHGGRTATLPNWDNDRADAPVTPMYPWPGTPYLPTGNPMLDGVGPGSFAARKDEPELTMDNIPAIVPLRVDGSIFIASEDPDPRGMPVIGCDGRLGGKVREVWVDRAEMLIRYLEVEVDGIVGRHVLLPMTMAIVDRSRKAVLVDAILGSQFASVPGLANPDQVTKLEEDKIVGYYGGGHLYATAARQEPLL